MSFILSLSLSTTLYDSLHMMIDDGDENGDDDDCSIAVFVVFIPGPTKYYKNLKKFPTYETLIVIDETREILIVTFVWYDCNGTDFR